MNGQGERNDFIGEYLKSDKPSMESSVDGDLVVNYNYLEEEETVAQSEMDLLDEDEAFLELEEAKEIEKHASARKNYNYDNFKIPGCSAILTSPNAELKELVMVEKRDDNQSDVMKHTGLAKKKLQLMPNLLAKQFEEEQEEERLARRHQR